MQLILGKMATLTLFYHENRIHKARRVKVFIMHMRKLCLKGIFGVDIDDNYCSSIDREAGFAINAELSFTNSTLKGL